MREDQPSSTAILIAAATVFLARDERVSDLVPAGAAAWCARCLEAVSPSRLKAVLAVSHPALRWAARLAERATVPGLLLHFMLRKRWIEEAVRASLDEGCEQVIIIGAGFDTLAVRLSADFPHARFIEIDHPATQKFKQLATERGSSCNLHFLAADLACDSLHNALSTGAAFRPDAPSAFVIEGLLMYLTAEQVAGVFMALNEAHRASARVVFTVMEPTPDGRTAFHNATPLVTWLLSHWSEPFKSSMRRDETVRSLERFGFSLMNYATAETLRTRYLASMGGECLTLAQGEMIAVAERVAGI